MVLLSTTTLTIWASALTFAASYVLDIRQQTSSTSAPTATVSAGLLRGRTTKLPDANVTVNQFLAIPFAQPPINNLRFVAPQPVRPWNGVYNATTQPKACLQYTGPSNNTDGWISTVLNDYDKQPDSEDCLYLNIYAPSGGKPNKPVLFWIYGGSGNAGAISDPQYDGSSFAANHDIVVVAANYRLNGEPYLSH
jgi:carboxylesterase type B